MSSAGSAATVVPKPLSLLVNGSPVSAQVEPRTSLADFLRDHLQLSGTHVSCEQGVCGACTVLLDGRPVRACITWAAGCEGASVQTIEAFDDDAKMAELRDAFTREHALQCGFCTPGMLITARDIAMRLPDADESRIRHELAGNLCRCTGYTGIVRAVCAVVGSPDRPASCAQRSASAPFAAFEPVDAGEAAPGTAAAAASRPAAAVAAVASAAATAEPAPAGVTRVSESIVVRGCDAQRLWALLADVRAAAGCLPGARIDRFDGRELAGAVRVAFGPVKANFAGTGTVERDEASRSTVIRGTGTDSLSKTEAQATIVYRVEPEPGAVDAARLAVGMDYVVQGPLAQFSRSDLVRSLVSQLVREFGRNLEAMAAGGPVAAPPAAGLNAFALLWRWLRERLAAFFGRGTGRSE